MRRQTANSTKSLAMWAWLPAAALALGACADREANGTTRPGEEEGIYEPAPMPPAEPEPTQPEPMEEWPPPTEQQQPPEMEEWPTEEQEGGVGEGEGEGWPGGEQEDW